MNEKHIQERKNILKYGYKKAMQRKNLEVFTEMIFITLSFPLVFVLANLFYGLFETLFLILRLCFKSVKRSQVYRDNQRRLYRRYEIGNKMFEIRKPFLVITIFCPRYFQIDSSLMY